ncbi:homeobox-like domain superfamily [Holotrichia oblita]|uniref:Homeobox-like domain superfamily n=1 Tax=Holotrichia oblita TaxID=644536 RepID=A0ACB9SQ72_HOLOL|nr:homeobox-like domain superfamily [Holotrichia oblita]
MQLAIEEMKTGESSLRNVAKKYNVPKSSLEFKIKNPGHKETFGPNTVLTEDEELRLVDWIKKMAQRGFPNNRENILDSVQTFLKDNPRKNPFKNNRPGHGWFQAFLKRHSDISSRTSEGVSSASSCISEKDIRG